VRFKTKSYQSILKKSLIAFLLIFSHSIYASFILIPMDDVSQTNHLKAYGITYWSLQKGNTAKMAAKL